VIQIVVPIAGDSNFFKPEDYPFPKPLVEVGGRPMIQRVIENLRTLEEDLRFTFIVQQEHVSRFSLDGTLRLLSPGCSIVSLRNRTMGGLCSALMAIDGLVEAAPLVVSNGDQVLNVDLTLLINTFRSTGADAGVPVFDSIHPRWSYVTKDAQDVVHEAVEKRVISRHAIAGFYYFKRAEYFIQAGFRHLKSGLTHDGNYYVASTLNELILDGKKVVGKSIDAHRYFSFYSPQKVKEFEDGLLMGNITRGRSASSLIPQVVIPAAGDGKRFTAAGFQQPKPFIDVRGQTMLERVIENVAPAGTDVTVLVRQSHLEGQRPVMERLQSQGITIRAVEHVTEGTACTLLLARDRIDNDRPLLIANSDQLVDFSVSEFIDDCRRRELDGSILVFRDLSRNPKWSFARVDNNGIVTEVAEKRPISDLATVGIYLFSHGSDFVRASIDMIANNDRVNNEFYTCPVFNYLIRAGKRVGVKEIPADAMSGLGTPEDLGAYLRQAEGNAR